MDKPILDKRIFWDVEFEKLDYQKHERFIIERVFERGDVEDIRQTSRFYGDEKVKNILVNAKFLPLASMYLACALFENKIEDYRCYTEVQLKKQPFFY